VHGQRIVETCQVLPFFLIRVTWADYPLGLGTMNVLTLFALAIAEFGARLDSPTDMRYTAPRIGWLTGLVP
jgi:hypothetical protein